MMKLFYLHITLLKAISIPDYTLLHARLPRLQEFPAVILLECFKQFCRLPCETPLKILGFGGRFLNFSIISIFNHCSYLSSLIAVGLNKRLQKLITEKCINETEQIWKATGENI